jgi:cytochrome c-type biogenesis protein CcmH/NrfG
MTVAGPARRASRPGWIVAVRAALALACAAGVACALIAFRSERRLDEVKRLALSSIDHPASTHGDARAEAARRKALRLVPSARLLNPDTDIDVQVGLFLEPNRRRARAVLERATRREPENVFLWLALSKKLQLEGDLAGARRSYARARQLDPRLRPLR